jgi:ABC-type uncharacterized transport system YnjBCD substrate-binding protein
MEWISLGSSLLASFVAFAAFLRSREAIAEAKKPAKEAEMSALVVEYQQILDEWLDKQNANHARAMKRLKSQERLLAAEAPPAPADSPQEDASGANGASAMDPAAYKQALRQQARQRGLW